jgi:hypothetical protein
MSAKPLTALASGWRAGTSPALASIFLPEHHDMVGRNSRQPGELPRGVVYGNSHRLAAGRGWRYERTQAAVRKTHPREDVMARGSDYPSGEMLNDLYGIKAAFGRYRETGDWYGPIKDTQSPAILWDGPPSYQKPDHGYVRFETRTDLESCPQLHVNPGGQITARQKGQGIKDIPHYVRPGQWAVDGIKL